MNEREQTYAVPSQLSTFPRGLALSLHIHFKCFVDVAAETHSPGQYFSTIKQIKNLGLSVT